MYVQWALCSVQWAVCSVLCAVLSEQWALHITVHVCAVLCCVVWNVQQNILYFPDWGMAGLNETFHCILGYVTGSTPTNMVLWHCDYVTLGHFEYMIFRHTFYIIRFILPCKSWVTPHFLTNYGTHLHYDYVTLGHLNIWHWGTLAIY